MVYVFRNVKLVPINNISIQHVANLHRWDTYSAGIQVSHGVVEGLTGYKVIIIAYLLVCARILPQGMTIWGGCRLHIVAIC